MRMMRDVVSRVATLWPHLSRVAPSLVIGSIAGIAMNTLVVLPPLMLGRSIDVATRYARGTATGTELLVAVALFVAASVATEGPRMAKRWLLTTARQRVVGGLRVAALAGALSMPMRALLATPVGALLSSASVKVVSA
mgnify:FL=1